MTLIAIGSGVGDFHWAGSSATVDTNASRLAPGVTFGFVRGSTIDLKAAFSDLWVSFHSYYSTSQSANVFDFRPATGTPLFRARNSTTGPTCFLEIWNGSAWDTVASAGGYLGLSASDKIDVHLSIHDSTGVFNVYVNGTLFVGYSGDTLRAGVSSVQQFGTGSYSAGSSVVSAFLFDTSSTIGRDIAHAGITGAGTYTAWTGTYADVDEAATVVDSDMIYSDTAGQRETVVTGALPGVFSAATIEAVVVSTRAWKAPGSLVDTIAHMVRASGVDQDGANITLDGAIDVDLTVFSTNPSTGLPWTAAAAGTCEIGVKVVS